MKHIDVLVLSKQRITAKLNWRVTNPNTVEKAIELLHQNRYKVAVVIKPFNTQKINKLDVVIKKFYPEINKLEITTEIALKETIHKAYFINKRRYNKHNYVDNSVQLQLAQALIKTQ